MTTYRIVEMFLTLQGEGVHAGTPAVFVRFAGCNLWSGYEKDRQRDFDRTGGACALFCDTAFTKGDRFTAAQIAETIDRLVTRAGGQVQHVVFTGGEPLLHLDCELLAAVRATPFGRHLTLAVETNGTVRPGEGVEERLDWICLSPKTTADKLAIAKCDELKVVFPIMNPLDFAGIDAEHWFVQPAAVPEQVVGSSTLSDGNTQAAIDFCLTHPLWRLSLQTHKFVGLP